MGTGSLKRIAALSLLATTAVFAGGAASVPAQLTVPSTTVTTPTVTVPSTTVRVPSTTTKVTTPTVTAPKQTVTTPKVKAPAPKPTVSAPTVKAPAPKAPAAVTKPVDRVKKTVSGAAPTGSTGGGSTGGGSGGGTLDVGGTVGGVTDSLANTVGGAAGTGGRTTGTPGSTPEGMTFLAGPGAGSGSTGGPGGIFGPTTGGGFSGGSTGAGGGSLAAMLSGASARELRLVLEQLEGCLPALPAGERRVISMRAGLGGAPLSRTQVGQRLGLSPRAVRNRERRALNRLQYAAANTGCAGAVVGPFDPAGIGDLSPQVVLAGAVPVGGRVAGDIAQTRGIVGRSASPLFALGSGGDGSGPAWAIILFTVLLSVAVAALTREVRHSF